MSKNTITKTASLTALAAAVAGGTGAVSANETTTPVTPVDSPDATSETSEQHVTPTTSITQVEGVEVSNGTALVTKTPTQEVVGQAKEIKDQADQAVEAQTPVVEDAKKRTTLYLTVVNLDNLIKGGRISQLMGMFSNLLNIKLFLQVINGKIEIIQKGRGLKSLQKKYDEIFEQMKSAPKGIQEIGIMHAGLSDFNEGNIARVRELFPDVPLTIVTTSPIIMSHTGVDAMAITYLENK